MSLTQSLLTFDPDLEVNESYSDSHNPDSELDDSDSDFESDDSNSESE